MHTVKPAQCSTCKNGWKKPCEQLGCELGTGKEDKYGCKSQEIDDGIYKCEYCKVLYSSDSLRLVSFVSQEIAYLDNFRSKYRAELYKLDEKLLNNPQELTAGESDLCEKLKEILRIESPIRSVINNDYKSTKTDREREEAYKFVCLVDEIRKRENVVLPSQE